MTEPSERPTLESTLKALLSLWGGIRPHEVKRQEALTILRAAEQAARDAEREAIEAKMREDVEGYRELAANARAGQNRADNTESAMHSYAAAAVEELADSIRARRGDAPEPRKAALEKYKKDRADFEDYYEIPPTGGE